MIKPFTVEFQPFIDDINNDAKTIRECADAATMKRIKGMYKYKIIEEHMKAN